MNFTEPTNLTVNLDELMAQREAIEDIDAQIIDLLHRRRSHSIMAQQAKAQMDLPSVSVGQENVVHNRYRDALGPNAGRLASAVLYLCTH